MNVDTPPN